MWIHGISTQDPSKAILLCGEEKICQEVLGCAGVNATEQAHKDAKMGAHASVGKQVR